MWLNTTNRNTQEPPMESSPPEAKVSRIGPLPTRREPGRVTSKVGRPPKELKAKCPRHQANACGFRRNQRTFRLKPGKGTTPRTHGKVARSTRNAVGKSRSQS